MKSDFKDILKYETNKINIELNDKMLDKFEKYKDLLLEWNEKMNLTAITDEYEIIVKHFIDCLEIVKYIDINKNLIDVGTGAGFPGIVIAIYFENNITITLLDSLNKRLIFLEEVIKILNLSNVRILHGRAEDIGQKIEYRENYDYAVSRAVSGLSNLIEFDTPYIKVGGKCLLMKSDNILSELEKAKRALDELKCNIRNIYKYSYKVDDETYSRSIVEIIRVEKTPKKYPRSYGKIKKEPL